MNRVAQFFSIGSRQVGRDAPPYCIAEVGINHNGDIDIAKRMIEVAKEVGADAVKFQTFKAEEFCGDPAQLFSYKSQGKMVTEPMLEMFKRYEFSPVQWREIKAHCDSVGITFFSTPQNRSDLDLLLEIGIPAIKIGSDDFTNLPLIKSYASENVPIILSCGMSDLAEVHQGLEAAGWFSGNPVALLLCTSQYPTPPKDVNVRKLTTLQQAFPGLLVGFSDHTQGPLAASLAVALGGRIFEKHFTLDHNLPGPDHWFSDEPFELELWLKNIRMADVMRGSPYLMPTETEVVARLSARRSIVAVKELNPGDVLDDKNITLMRPGNGLPSSMLNYVCGAVVNCKIKQGQQLKIGDFS